MAHLDTLIDLIPDEKLKSEIQDQVSKLAAKASFGLVYEEHRPETVVLPGFEVSRGGKVVFRDASTAGIWVVRTLANGTATMLRKGDPSQRMTAPVDNLWVVREFGDPIYPGLESITRIEKGGDKPFHAVINGENYHVTEMMLYPYEKKIDVIYLDPPYNTGAKDWKYNNRYVDDKDQYRHSKWLSFIEKRLKLAKRLLNPKKSVLIFTIDEKEYLRAGLLLEKIFDDAQIQMVSSVINPTGTSRGGTFKRTDEYIFFVFVGDAKVSTAVTGWEQGKQKPDATAYWRNLRRSGNDSLRSDREGSFFPIFVDSTSTNFHSIGQSLSLDTDRSSVSIPPGTIAVWPIQPNGAEGRWQLGQETLQKAIDSGYVRIRGTNNETFIQYLARGEQTKVVNGTFGIVGREPSGALILSPAVDTNQQVPGTAWQVPAHSARHHGAALLSQLIPGRTFPYPKSLYAVEDALRFVLEDNHSATVVDLFGGSGTTAHAVMRLNRQDGGRRASIVVTNNAVSDSEDKDLREQGFTPGDPDYESLGIFEHITMPRLIAAVTGRTYDGTIIPGEYAFNDKFSIAEGFEENIEFFKLTYEDNHLVRLGNKFEAIAPILWMKAGARGGRIDALPSEGWAMPEDGYYGLLTDIDQWEPFVEAVNARDDVQCVFIVTDSQAEFETINVQIGQGVESRRLYADYLLSFEINTRQG
ncbi:DNA methyltransferase [Arthrobacter pityocampae]|uniref:DNA methyltransferase n=1 Tax=Arthrobacter pityocampae TaxID=547334 RepID=UPI003734DF3E